MGKQNHLRRRWGLGLACFSIVIAGCSASDRMAKMASSQEAMGGASMGTAQNHIAGGGESAKDSPITITLASMTESESEPDRFLVRNATLGVEVGDPNAAQQELVNLAKTIKGYVGNIQENVDGLGSRTITLEMRVPATQFESCVQKIVGLGKLKDRHVTAEDVTEEFVDSTSKLRNLKRTEDRLLTHMAKTGKLSDTILVERELNRVRGEIESIEGRLRFLKHRIVFSTLSVTLSETPKIGPAAVGETYSAGRQAGDAVRSLVGFGQSALTFGIWLAIWAVVWIPILLVARFAYRRLRQPPASI